MEICTVVGRFAQKMLCYGDDNDRTLITKSETMNRAWSCCHGRGNKNLSVSFLCFFFTNAHVFRGFLQRRQVEAATRSGGCLARSSHFHPGENEISALQRLLLLGCFDNLLFDREALALSDSIDIFPSLKGEQECQLSRNQHGE
jgi:hypothetical protein